jgi:FkbM family methyltransferase
VINKIKGLIKVFFRKFGIQISGYNPNSSNEAQLIRSLEEFEIDLVIDVGANTGQFAKGLRDSGFKGNIVSFEPLTSAHEKLLKAKKNDAKWQVYKRTAIGDKNGLIEINIAGNSASSSILPMLDSHKKAAPHSAYIGVETSPISKLDDIYNELLKDAKNPFLKIDTQGFEWQVLDGAEKALPHIKGLLLELSLTPLYEGQRLWIDLIQRLQAQGFTLWSLQTGFTDGVNGRTYQVDGIFYRNYKS